jgi:GT2 family glycosyltransferase
MFCSVIIPAANAGRTIGECILATLSQSVPREIYEVIVVDDGSRDQTGRIARATGVRVISQPRRGLAAARNAGARIAAGDILVFLNPDCVPKLDWLAQMLAPFEEPTVAGVRGAYQTHEEGLLPRTIQADCDDAYRRLAERPAIDAVEGYSAAYRREIFRLAGGFDPSLAHADDVDLSYRLAARGFRLVFAPKACVYRRHGSDVGRYLEQNLRTGLWQALLYARHPAKLRDRSSSADHDLSEVPLAAAAIASLVAGTRWPRLLPFAGIALAGFAAAVFPSAWRARRAGTDVALAIPGLRFLRALALGTGLAAGGGVVVGQSLSERAANWVRSFGRQIGR